MNKNKPNCTNKTKFSLREALGRAINNFTAKWRLCEALIQATPLLFSHMVTCPCHPILSRLPFNLSKVCSSQWSRPFLDLQIPRLCLFRSEDTHGRACVRFSFFFFGLFVMSTLGTLGYYADSHIPHEDDDHLAPRFPTAPVIQNQTREPSLSEYGEPDSYPFQSKSAVFGASWSPVPVQPPGGTSIAYHPYIHQPCPTAESDGVSARAWALESLSASVPFAGLSTDVHHDIKLEPLVGSGECTTLDARTLMAPDAQNNANPAAKEADLSHADVTEPSDEKTLTETKPDLDPSKCMQLYLIWLPHFFFFGIVYTVTHMRNFTSWVTSARHIC